MAIDECMLVEYRAGNIPPTFRLYRWSPSALSLGYFQDSEAELDIVKCDREEVPFVRRMTGGGIIFHRDELTYSLICSQHDIEEMVSGSSYNVKDTYKIVCSFLMTAYRKLGLSPQYALDCPNQNSGNDAYRGFCFSSRERYDIVIDGKKLGGNAQKRQRDTIFQHGSVPLRLNPTKATSFLRQRPQEIRNNVCSLEEVLGREIDVQEFKAVLEESFKETFGIEVVRTPLTCRELEVSERLRRDKYKTREWNILRNARNN